MRGLPNIDQHVSKERFCSFHPECNLYSKTLFICPLYSLFSQIASFFYSIVTVITPELLQLTIADNPYCSNNASRSFCMTPCPVTNSADSVRPADRTSPTMACTASFASSNINPWKSRLITSGPMIITKIMII